MTVSGVQHPRKKKRKEVKGKKFGDGPGQAKSKVNKQNKVVGRVYSPPCPWDTHYQFSIKTLLSNKRL